MNKLKFPWEMSMEALHPLEYKILHSLGKNKSVDYICEKTGLKKDEVMRALQWLKTKKLISLEEQVSEHISLTKMGKHYMKQGLPETQFLKILPATVEKLRAKLESPEFNVSMGTLKKQGKIKVSEGNVVRTGAGVKHIQNKDGEKLLKRADGARYNDFTDKEKQILDSFKKRGIIKTVLKKERKASINSDGVRARVHSVQGIERLTHKTLSTGSWKGKVFRPYNINDPVSKIDLGKKQPYRRFLDDLKLKLTSLGFKQMSGPIVEMSFFNCDALYMPQNHVARGIHDLYFTENPSKGNLSKYKKVVDRVAKAHESGVDGSTGWEYKFSQEEARKLILRSHGTALSARWLMNQPEIPGKYFAMARCFRPDVVDATHNAEFFQVEGIILGEKLGLRDLFGVLKMFATEVAGVKKFKIIPGYFPFTEPSAELHGWFDGRWVEIGGSGIFRPELTKPLGIDVPVIAWGLGLDRQFMMAKDIKDIRQLFSQNIGWLREVTF
jgi:phenylalanyl-tRNA synthetase alpha chain